MANRGLLDASMPEDQGNNDSGTTRIGIITNRAWKEAGSITFWLHTNPPGMDAITPTHRAVGRFPTWVEHDGRTWLSLGERYVLPDTVVSSLGQKRWRRKEDRDAGRHVYPYWYTEYDRARKCHTNIPRYSTVSPHWLVYHAVADALESGDLSVGDAVFHWDFEDRNNQAQTMTWKAGEILGRLVYGGDADYRRCLAPSYESVLVIVDNENVGRGPQIMLTTAMLAGGQPPKSREPGYDAQLGKLIQTIHADRRSIEAENALRAKKGLQTRDLSIADPYTAPYPFTLTWLENAPVPTDKYTVGSLRMQASPGEIYAPTDEIMAAIQTPIDPEDIEFVLRPRAGDFDRLYHAMRSAADAANCRFLLERLDAIFQPWSDQDHGSGSSKSSSPSARTFCSCGLEIETSWAACPNCNTTLRGDSTPPDIEEIVDTAYQKCPDCGHIFGGLESPKCPECGSNNILYVEPLDVGY